MPQAKVHASHAARQAAYRKRSEAERVRQTKEKGLPALPAVATIPGIPRWRQMIDSANTLLVTALTEMEDYFADRSEQWQEGDKGERFREWLDAVTQAHEAVAELSLN